MLRLLDRQMMRGYFKSYLVCLVSLLGMFIVIDLFMNLEDFRQGADSLSGTFHNIARYYGFKVTQIFDRLCEPIVLLAAMFTVAWMQRNNELLPLLSAGVSTRRVVRPVLFASCVMLCLSVLNLELLMPQVDGFLVENRSNQKGEKDTEAKGGYESNGIHIHGISSVRKDLMIKNFTVVFPAKMGREGITTLQAQTARYLPPGDNNKNHAGGWLLEQTTPPEIDNPDGFGGVLEMIVPGKYFLKTSEVDYEYATRHKNWHQFVTTLQLMRELGKIDSNRQSSIAVLFHMRLTRPILGMILVFMGLSVILRDQNRNVFISAALCLGLCGLFFGALFACKYLGDHEHLQPVLAAWLPVLGFGPLSFVMFDAVHT